MQESPKLTPRQQQILDLVQSSIERSGAPPTRAEIAAELVLSTLTVKTHVTNLLTKLQLRDRTQAVVLAYESGFVAPGEADDRP